MTASQSRCCSCLPACLQAIKPKLLFHSMQPLDGDAARELFRRHHTLTPEQISALHLSDREEELLTVCSGVPLALEVIGSQLAVEPASSVGLYEAAVQARWKVGLWALSNVFPCLLRKTGLGAPKIC